MKFKFIEHTADMGIEAYGKDFKETFENAALGMFEIMTDTSKVEEKQRKIIVAKGEDLKSLLYDFLEQFLIIHDAENLIFSRVIINSLENNKIKAEAFGEEFNPGKHTDRTTVKAITYQRMNVTPTKIFFIVDI